VAYFLIKTLVKYYHRSQKFFRNWSQSSKTSGVKDKRYLSKSQIRIKVSKVQYQQVSRILVWVKL